MGIEGFERNLSEESKKALQSETWQKVRDSMKEKKEVKHFTAENTAENAYGWTWDQVVKEYLRSGYNAEDKSPDIVVMGETYKTLKRLEVTVFYDAAGDTLFDVTNERLEKEYEWLMNSGAGDTAENMNTREEDDADGKGDLVVEQTEEDPEAGEAPQTERAEEDEPGSASDVTGENAESEQEPPKPVESETTSKQEIRPVKQLAEEKLKKELAAAKDKSFADPIISYLLKRMKGWRRMWRRSIRPGKSVLIISIARPDNRRMGIVLLSVMTWYMNGPRTTTIRTIRLRKRRKPKRQPRTRPKRPLLKKIKR